MLDNDDKRRKSILLDLVVLLEQLGAPPVPDHLNLQPKEICYKRSTTFDPSLSCHLLASPLNFAISDHNDIISSKEIAVGKLLVKTDEEAVDITHQSLLCWSTILFE